MAIHRAVLGLDAAHPPRSAEVARRPFAPARGKPLRKTVRASAGAGLRAAAALAPRAAAVHLGPAMTAQEAFAVIALNCSAHVMVSAKFAEHCPDGVHELRVAIRRMRAALSIVRRAAAADRRFRIEHELRALQRQLGGAREWDVLVDETIARLPKALRTARKTRDLRAAAQRRRRAAHRGALAALRDPRCRDLLRRLHAWIDAAFIYGPQRRRNRRWRPDLLAAPATAFAAATLEAHHARARKLAAKIRDLDARELHRLRIRIKTLRYAAEFFASLWPGRPLRRYLAAVQDLQRGLGAWHDVAVARGLIARLALPGGGASPAARWLARRERALRKDVAALWSRFAKRKRFWADT